MNEDRVVALEIALKAVMAVARNQGVEVDKLCQQSIGAIIGEGKQAAYVENAIAEIEKAQAALARLPLPSS